MAEEIFEHCNPIEPSTAQATGCFTILPVRIHKRDDIANEATLKSMQEWGDHIGDGWDKKSGSALSPVGNWCSFIFPESLPERLGVITYLANMGNIHDDACEEMDLQAAVDEHKELSIAMDPDQSESIDSASKSMKFKSLLSDCILECISLDRENGLRMLESYRKKWLDVMEHPDIGEVQTLEEYLEFRYLNGGMEPFWLMCQFGMGITISDADVQLIRHIFAPAEAALVLTNDWWSWHREFELSKKTGRQMVNSIDLFMRTKSFSVQEARDAVRQAIISYEADYLRCRTKFYHENPDISVSLRRYLEVCGVVVAGNHYWCANCPRHNAWHREHVVVKEEGSSAPEEIASADMEVQASHSDSSRTSSNSDDSDWMSPQSLTTNTTLSPTRQPSSFDRGAPWKKLSDSPALAPINYINSLPSKGVRSILIDALNQWLKVSPDSLRTISQMINQLHNASLILDDIEDNSPLRRGSPSAHTIFGASQCINSANLMYVHAAQQARKLKNPKSLDALLEGLDNLYIGQSWDLYWTFHVACPTENEYLNMIDNKTGGMFRMLLDLMQLESPFPCTADFTNFTRLLGRFFQIRDDYMNLKSSDYTDQKGFCEDLDEGKFGFPVVHCHDNHPELAAQITGVFRLHKRDPTSPTLPHKTKEYIVQRLESLGTFKATLDRLKELEMDLEEEIASLEKHLGMKNSVLRLLLTTLAVENLS